jgi:hypothetical protein
MTSPLRKNRLSSARRSLKLTMPHEALLVRRHDRRPKSLVFFPSVLAASRVNIFSQIPNFDGRSQ